MKENNKINKNPRISVPQWQIPPGVTSGNFDYTNSANIADQYDQFLAGNPLNELDGEVLDRYLPTAADTAPQQPIVADFGCGNGRSLMPLLEKDYRAIGIDLSQPMLRAFTTKAQAAGVANRVMLAQANLVQLDAFADQIADAGICMFSTLGMIHGRNNRAAFLKHVHRILKPEASFIVHAHNAWFQIRNPGGLKWAATSFLKSVTGKEEFGDRTATYRGVKNMFIHSFRRNELKRDLESAGFKIERWIGILPNDTSTNIDRPLLWLSNFRLVGWTIVCRKA